MKRVLLLVLTTILINSCWDFYFDSKVEPTPPDPADAFVGNYSFTDNYFVRWGNDSKSSSYTSKFTLTKISANMIQMTGAWTTTGTVTSNTVQFNSCPQSDSEGYVNYSFGTGILSGNTLTFSYSGYGQRRYYGVAYPWETSGNVTAILSSQL